MTDKVYDPNKNYQWDAEDEFILNGKEVETFGKLIRILQNEPEYKKAILLQRAGELLDNVFKRNVNVLSELEEAPK